MKTIKDKIEELNNGEKIYAGTVVPMFISFMVYMFLGIPVLMP